MTITRKTTRARRATVALLGLGIASATVLAGCSADAASGGSGEESGVAWGASKEEYQAALADMEPIEFTIQSGAAAPDIVSNQPLLEWVDRIEEYSGGKMTFDITYAYGIGNNVLDFDDMLLDGRIDFSYFWPQYDPAEYPAANVLLEASVLRDPQLIAGYYSSMAAANEVGFATPEVVEEWTKKGITPLNIMSTDGMSLISCREPVTTLADLKGKQIRSGATVHSRQIEGLGAIPVSLPYPEVYEALQRGILDCALSAHEVATNGAWLEVAPYMIHTSTVSFASTPTNWYAGPRFLQLPKAAQQLIAESTAYFTGGQGEYRIADVMRESFPDVQEYGGEWLTFDPEVDAKLAEINDEILAGIEASKAVDGKDLVERYRAATEKWNAKVAELGYADGGPMSEFDQWFTESPNSDAWAEAFVLEVLAKLSPVNTL